MGLLRSTRPNLTPALLSYTVLFHIVNPLTSDEWAHCLHRWESDLWLGQADVSWIEGSKGIDQTFQTKLKLNLKSVLWLFESVRITSHWYWLTERRWTNVSNWFLSKEGHLGTLKHVKLCGLLSFALAPVEIQCYVATLFVLRIEFVTPWDVELC